MSDDDNQQQKTPPVAVHRDGAVAAKVWRNHTQEGAPFYSVTFERSYTDPATGEPRSSRSFQGTDILKLQQLAGEAYQSVARLKARDRQNEPQAEHDPGLAEQRDAAMAEARPAPRAEGGRQQTRSRSAPER